MIFDYSVILENLPLYLAGMLVTLKLLVISLTLGLLSAVPLALMRVSRNPLVNLPAWLYTYVIRGTPMLVQLFLIYYGLAQFEALRASALWPYLSNATFCACIAFRLHRRDPCWQFESYTSRRDRGGKSCRHVACQAVSPDLVTFGPAPGAAAIQQRSDHDAAHHLPGVDCHTDRHYRCRTHGEFAVLPAV